MAIEIASVCGLVLAVMVLGIVAVALIKRPAPCETESLRALARALCDLSASRPFTFMEQKPEGGMGASVTIPPASTGQPNPILRGGATANALTGLPPVAAPEQIDETDRPVKLGSLDMNQ